MEECTKVVSKGEFSWAKEDIFCCDNCGASGPENQINHFKGCKPGEAKKWEKYYQSKEWQEAD